MNIVLNNRTISKAVKFKDLCEGEFFTTEESKFLRQKINDDSYFFYGDSGVRVEDSSAMRGRLIYRVEISEINGDVRK